MTDALVEEVKKKEVARVEEGIQFSSSSIPQGSGHGLMTPLGSAPPGPRWTTI